VIRILNGLALFVLAILIAQLLAACDLDKARSSKATGQRVGEVHSVGSEDDEEAEPVEEEEEPPPVVDPNANEACWGDISYQQWLENDCPGDPPPGGP
jgi:hypothetical protein